LRTLGDPCGDQSPLRSGQIFKAPISLGRNPDLFGQRWQWKRHLRQLHGAEVLDADTSGRSGEKPAL
jgi:hypothetical protein